MGQAKELSGWGLSPHTMGTLHVGVHMVLFALIKLLNEVVGL